jgi:hypothetical protein
MARTAAAGSRAVPAPAPVDPAGGTLLFSTTVENGDTVPTWANQELSAGQAFAKGDVPDGTSLTATIDGAAIPLQVSNRVFWTDGSLKHAQVRMVVPASIPVGGTKTLSWRRVSGPWTAHDAPLHTAPSAVTSRVALEWAFTSWTGRTVAGVLTAQRGPKYFRSADMLGAGNAAWIETVMAGRLVTEWRATAMAAKADGSADANLGAFLYARAWRGTANSPARIEFVFRSMFGWSDGAIPADEQGVQASIDLKVNGTVVRGASLASPTAGWANRDSYVGGFYASPGPTGRMDWYDVATDSFVTPPVLVYRQNTAYGVATRFFPPYDTNNPSYAAQAAPTFAPQGRGILNPDQDEVGDNANLSWTTSLPFCWAMVAHARRPVAEAVSQSQLARVNAWGMAALGGHAFNRTTRKIICYLPPARNPNPTVLGASVWSGARPSGPTDKNLNAYIRNQDAAHFPQVAWWTYLTEGDQHMLDLVYAEATLPGAFSDPAFGFFTTLITRAGPNLQVGGIVKSGQVRGVAHGVRPIVNAMAIGNPADPHHQLVTAMWNHWHEVIPEQVYEQDRWRTTIWPNPDGRNFTDVRTLPYSSSQEPETKVWMHAFGLHALAYGHGITENPRVREWAEWWAHTPTVLAGGWHDDDVYLMKPDPAQIDEYYHITDSAGTGATNQDRRIWAYHIQWGGGPHRVTFTTDNQTIDFGTPLFPHFTVANGQVVTITGVHKFDEPATVIDMTKIPAGLVRGQVYYTVQASGTTAKLSTTLNGPPVTFDAGGAAISGHLSHNSVFGAPGHVMRTAANVSTGATAYFIQIMFALDMYQHYCAPTDARVRLARQKLKALKVARGGGYDLRGLSAVAP